MKVDITGRGFINGIGILPARGLEMSDVGISRLLNFNGVRVFDATTGLQITRATLDDMRKKKMEELKKQETKPVEKKPAQKIETPTIPKADEPAVVVKKEEVPVEVVPEPLKFEATVTPYITEPVVEEAPVVEEEVVEETPVVEEEVVTEEEITTEETTEETTETTTTTEEEKPFYGKKRNKKNRNK